MKSSIKFILNPNDNEIKKVGEKSVTFMKSHGFSNDAVATEAMIIRELIKNGEQFGCPTPPNKEITVCLQIGKNEVVVEVKKPVAESTRSQLIELDKTIQWIRGYQDPFEPYFAKLIEASDNSLNDDTNGFGLARIAYEARAVLDFYVSEDNFLYLSAARSLTGADRS